MKKFWIMILLLLGSNQLFAMGARGSNSYQASPDARESVNGGDEQGEEPEVYCQCSQTEVGHVCGEWWFDPLCCFMMEDKPSTCHKCGMFVLKAVTCPVCCATGLIGCWCWYGRGSE